MTEIEQTHADVVAERRKNLVAEAAAESRKLVTVREISAINDIEGADLIKVAQVEGWQVVVKAGEFKPGDLCVFFEVDSYLPLDDERYSFLAKNGINWNEIPGARLKTIRLRGQLSQGLALPLSAFPEIETAIKGVEDVRSMNFTDVLGIMKWEKAIPAQLQGKIAGNFPTFLRKSDQERAQNMARDIFGYDDELVPFDPANIPQEALIYMMEKGEVIVSDGHMHKVRKATASRDTQYEVTMKLDGSSMTVFGYAPGWNEGPASGVCSRNLQLKIEGNEDNTFVKLATELGLLKALKEGEYNVAIQGELMGPGIQGNREDFKVPRFFVYNVFDINRGEFLNPRERVTFIDEFREDNGVILEHVPTLAWGKTLAELGITNMAELLAYAVGPSIAHKVREGLVFKALDGRHQFKAISNEFLLKEKE